jgi:hypothetical protein
MPKRETPIARIRLARSLRRMLALPLLLALGGAAAVAAGLLVVDGTAGLVLAGGGAALVVGAVIFAIVLLSVRVDVEETAIGVTWLGGGRVYPLTAGPVTRVRLRGTNASRLRARSRWLGWGIGRARLREHEAIEVVRLAPTATAILVPTDRGRLAIAPASDDELLDALSRAARARQRLADIAEPAPADVPAAPPEPEPEAEPEPEPPPMTGIERALLELRLAEERAAAEAEAAALAASEAEEAEAAAAVEPEVSIAPSPLPAPAGEPPRRTARLRGRVSLRRRPRPAVALVFVPLLAAGAAWGVGLAAGRMPEPGTDLARLTSLGLVLAGPATSIGAIMALAWWPRLVGVVVAGGVAAAVFIGRALIGA